MSNSYILLDSMLIKLHETVEMDHTQRLKDERSPLNHENPNIFCSHLERFLYQPKPLFRQRRTS